MQKNVFSKAIKLTLAGLLLTACGGGSGSTSTAGTESSGTSATEAPAEKQESVTTVIEGEAATEQVDRIVVAVNSPSTDASPFAMNTPTRGIVKEALYATLFYIEPGHFVEDAQPYIGKTITKVDDLTYDVEIFDNITDSKGNPITADDVFWSYEYSFRNQELLNYGTDVESLTVVDPTHLQFKLTKKIPGTIEGLIKSGALTIVNQAWFEGATDEERQMDPATTGPYTLKEHVSGSSIVVEARDDYWKTDKSQRNPVEMQNVKEIDFKVISENSMRAIALENKEVDYAQIQPNELHRFFENGKSKDGYNVWIGNAGTPMYNVVFLNMEENSDSVFANDINLRKAALYALSSEDIMLASGATLETGTVLKGFGVEGQGGYPASWDEADHDYYNYDPEKAHEFYKASGHADGEVTVRFMTNISIYSDSVRSVMIANLEEAGFTVEPLAVDAALMLKYRFETNIWDMEMAPKLAGDHVVTGWDNLFNPVGYTNGSVCFTHDDKLVELLNAAVNDATEENINAFDEYMTDQAICKAIFVAKSITVAQDGILEQTRGTNGGFTPSGAVYAKDYKSAVNK